MPFPLIRPRMRMDMEFLLSACLVKIIVFLPFADAAYFVDLLTNIEPILHPLCKLPFSNTSSTGFNLLKC